MDGDGDLAGAGERSAVGGRERDGGVRGNHRARGGGLGDGWRAAVVGGGDAAGQVGQGCFAVAVEAQRAGVGGAGRYFRWRVVYHCHGNLAGVG